MDVINRLIIENLYITGINNNNAEILSFISFTREI